MRLFKSLETNKNASSTTSLALILNNRAGSAGAWAGEILCARHADKAAVFPPKADQPEAGILAIWIWAICLAECLVSAAEADKAVERAEATMSRWMFSLILD